MGKHPCIAWLPILWVKCRDLFTKHNKGKDNAPPLVELSEVDEEIKEGPIPDLPFDIITNILTRLPAKCIFRLWHQTNSNDDHVLYNLTTDPYFIRTHLDRGQATPTIAVKSLAQSVDNDIKLFIFDDKGENVEATSLDLSSWNAYCKGHPIDLWGSYDGFLLFRSRIGPAHFSIWNPVTKEQVTVTSPHSLLYVCGFYFHPRKKECEVVSACTCYYNGSCARNDFQILSLRTKHRRSIGSPYPPCTKKSPVFINGIFYWMVDCFGYLMQNGVRPSLSDSILSFNIATEEFNTIEAVAPSNDDPHKRYPGNVFQLFESEGDLFLFDPSSSTEVVIWVYNHSTKRWDKKHSVTSPWYLKKHHWDFYSHFTEIEYINMIGEFLAYDFHSTGRPYIYNLRSSTWKLLEKKGFEKDRFTATMHTHGLVSLDAASSVISLVEN